MTTPDYSKKRNVFLTANKYQDKIILLSFVPSACIFIAFMLIVFIGNPIISKAVFSKSLPTVANLIYTFTGAIVFILCLIILSAIMIAFVISHHLVGAFGRIIRDLDDIIEGRSKRNITYRPGDDLAADLLKRVNVLVEFYVKHKTNNTN